MSDGYISAIPVLNRNEAKAHRRSLETAEASFGSLHYRSKAHTILTSPWQLASHPKVLDIARLHAK